MKESRRLLQHFLAAHAHRTQKAPRDAPDTFGDFTAGTFVRTPHELHAALHADFADEGLIALSRRRRAPAHAA